MKYMYVIQFIKNFLIHWLLLSFIRFCRVLFIHLWCLSLNVLSVLLVLWLQDLTKHIVAPPPAVVPPVSDWPTFPNCWPLLPPGPRAKSWRSALRSGPFKFCPQGLSTIWNMGFNCLFYYLPNSLLKVKIHFHDPCI